MEETAENRLRQILICILHGKSYMNHILLGASIPFAVVASIYILRGCRISLRMLIITPICIVASAIWAIAPDLPRLLRYSELYYRLAADPRCDIFYWHYSIDFVEKDSPWFLAGCVLIGMLITLAAWRELRLSEGS